MTGETRWLGSWAASPVPTEGLSFAGETLRMIARASLGGSCVRVRLSNAYGQRGLAIGGAGIGLRGKDAALVPGTARRLTFGGEASATIAAGALVVSDPVELPVPALADVAVSIHVPGELGETFAITGHGNAHQTNYVSAPGNHVLDAAMPVARTTENWYLLAAIEVLAPADGGAIVCYGDSLTDGNLSSLDANMRWPDQLARRLAARRGGRPLGVLNHGIGGNRILHDVRGDSGLRRFDRDAIAQPGATHVIVFLGTNDLRNRWAKPEEEVTAAQMIAGLKQIAARGRGAGLKIYGCTILPFENETFLPGAWTPARDRHRIAVNEWMRAGGVFDAIIDFEKTLRDPAHPTRMRAECDCGDHLHPSDFGYRTLGDSIDLALFE